MTDGDTMSEKQQIHRVPTKRENESEPAPMRAEAIAMRRIIAERGHWLSPFMSDAPVPEMSKFEMTVDLTKLDHNHKHRQDAAARVAVKQGARGAQSTRQTVYRNETLAEYRDRTARNNKAKTRSAA